MDHKEDPISSFTISHIYGAVTFTLSDVNGHVTAYELDPGSAAIIGASLSYHAAEAVTP